uniref:Uncharacterized protein n=1 Tax=Rhizobium rhizogenes TaxID=359 RepID=A0A2Z2PJ68_RHIRH|nr:hypothetical protein [Rhizobium rhizogenes]ASK42937.1 hypothetical protein [Rhizobium rhizogenes]
MTNHVARLNSRDTNIAPLCGFRSYCRNDSGKLHDRLLELDCTLCDHTLAERWAQFTPAEVQSGVKLASETGQVLKTIEGYIVTVNHHADSSATSAREQSVRLADVNTAVNLMDQMTQQNAAMAEESNAASASLAGEGTASRSRRPVRPPARFASPARRMASGVTKAFAGKAAVKQVAWEEFRVALPDPNGEPFALGVIPRGSPTEREGSVRTALGDRASRFILAQGSKRFLPNSRRPP